MSVQNKHGVTNQLTNIYGVFTADEYLELFRIMEIQQSIRQPEALTSRVYIQSDD